MAKMLIHQHRSIKTAHQRCALRAASAATANMRDGTAA